MRYFIFFYQFSKNGMSGNGNLSFKCKIFPSRIAVTNQALTDILLLEPSIQYKHIVITNFTELSESDYNNWTNNNTNAQIRNY
jgi:hypothetical protein